MNSCSWTSSSSLLADYDVELEKAAPKIVFVVVKFIVSTFVESCLDVINIIIIISSIQLGLQKARSIPRLGLVKDLHRRRLAGCCRSDLGLLDHHIRRYCGLVGCFDRFHP